jgi:hypothetical protein
MSILGERPIEQLEEELTRILGGLFLQIGNIAIPLDISN